MGEQCKGPKVGPAGQRKETCAAGVHAVRSEAVADDISGEASIFKESLLPLC